MLTICIQSNLKTLLLENNDMGIYKRLQKVSQFQYIKKFSFGELSSIFHAKGKKAQYQYHLLLTITH